MFAFEDLTGQRFHRLVAVRYTGADRNRVSLWLFKCDCGGEVVARGSAVKRGRTKSCGCIARKWQSASFKKYGAAAAKIRISVTVAGARARRSGLT